MGFCTDDEYEKFFRSVPEFERMLVRLGIRLIKYLFSIEDEEQKFRFNSRIFEPPKRWKLSPIDLESRRRWEDYTRAKEVMLERNHIPVAPWWVVPADNKKKYASTVSATSSTKSPIKRWSKTQSPCQNVNTTRTIFAIWFRIR